VACSTLANFTFDWTAGSHALAALARCGSAPRPRCSVQAGALVRVVAFG
jgi:hypothetical protein